MAYKAVCFDIDGTLYPAGTMNFRLFRIALRHPLLNLRYRKNRKLFRQCQSTYGKSIALRRREAMIMKDRSAAEPSVMPEGDVYEKQYGKMYSRLQNDIYEPMRRMYGRTKPFDGVRSTFEKIHNNGLKIGVFTDFPLFDKLKGMNLEDLVDFAASSDEAGFLKPDSHCFTYLLYNLGMDAKDVLYVGDSYTKDVAGAVNAGMDAVLVNTGKKRDGARYPLAKAVFTDWNEFDTWLTATMEER